MSTKTEAFAEAAAEITAKRGLPSTPKGEQVAAPATKEVPGTTAKDPLVVTEEPKTRTGETMKVVKTETPAEENNSRETENKVVTEVNKTIPSKEKTAAELKVEERKYAKPTTEDEAYIASLRGEGELKADSEKLKDKEGHTPDPSQEGSVTTTEGNKKETGKVQEAKTTVAERHPLLDAFETYLANGGSDPAEFANEVGAIGDVAKTPIRTLIEMQARAAGIPEDELADAVEEKMDALDALGRIDRAEAEKNLRGEYANKNKEKLSSYIQNKSTAAVQENKRLQVVYDTATDALTQEIAAITNKKVGVIFIDEKMAKAISEIVPYESPQVMKDGKLVQINVKEGVEFAIQKLYGRLRDVAHIDMGKAIGYEEAFNERHRPNENNQGSQNFVTRTQPQTAEEAGDALAAKRNPSKWKKTA